MRSLLLLAVAVSVAAQNDTETTTEKPRVALIDDCPLVDPPEVRHGCFWNPIRDVITGCVVYYSQNCLANLPPYCQTVEQPRAMRGCSWISMHQEDGCITDFKCEPDDCEIKDPPGQAAGCFWFPVRNQRGCIDEYECAPSVRSEEVTLEEDVDFVLESNLKLTKDAGEIKTLPTLPPIPSLNSKRVGSDEDTSFLADDPEVDLSELDDIDLALKIPALPIRVGPEGNLPVFAAGSSAATGGAVLPVQKVSIALDKGPAISFPRRSPLGSSIDHIPRGPVPRPLLPPPPVPIPPPPPVQPVLPLRFPPPPPRPIIRPVLPAIPVPLCPTPPGKPRNDDSCSWKPSFNRAGCIVDWICKTVTDAPPLPCPRAPSRPKNTRGCNWITVTDTRGCVLKYECEPPNRSECETLPQRPDDTVRCQWQAIKDTKGCVVSFKCIPRPRYHPVPVPVFLPRRLPSIRPPVPILSRSRVPPPRARLLPGPPPPALLPNRRQPVFLGNGPPPPQPLFLENGPSPLFPDPGPGPALPETSGPILEKGPSPFPGNFPNFFPNSGPLFPNPSDFPNFGGPLPHFGPLPALPDGPQPGPTAPLPPPPAKGIEAGGPLPADKAPPAWTSPDQIGLGPIFPSLGGSERGPTRFPFADLLGGLYGKGNANFGPKGELSGPLPGFPLVSTYPSKGGASNGPKGGANTLDLNALSGSGLQNLGGSFTSQFTSYGFSKGSGSSGGLGKGQGSFGGLDLHELCCWWATIGECESNANPFYMRTKCQKSCGTAGCTVDQAESCQVNVNTLGCPWTAANPPPLSYPVPQPTPYENKGGSAPTCFDNAPLCPFWKSIGQCKSQAQFMGKICPKSCGKC